MDPTDSYHSLQPPLESRPPIFTFISDKHLSLALPIIAYWFYSAIFHFLDLQTWPCLEKYRLHPPEEVLKRNRVTRWQVVRDVLVQQLGQIVVGVIVLRTEADEGLPDHSLALRQLQSPPWNLPNLASAEVVYWGLLPLLRLVIAICLLDAWEYWIHRFMHVNKFLYRHIHIRHHRLYVPYAYGALYNHPLEGLILDTVGTAIAMKIACLTLREAMFFFVFATMKTGIPTSFTFLIEVDDHCGWNFPWDPFQFLFSNNSVYHDVHHQTYGIKANYAQPFFTFWDRISGTYMAPRTPNKATKETIIVQELGNSATEGGSRKRRKSIASNSPTKISGGIAAVKTNTGMEINGTMNGSSKGHKLNGTGNGIGSRGMLVVEK